MQQILYVKHMFIKVSVIGSPPEKAQSLDAASGDGRVGTAQLQRHYEGLLITVLTSRKGQL